MAKRKSTPAPTLASLRKLAKRKGYEMEVEAEGCHIEYMPMIGNDHAPYVRISTYNYPLDRKLGSLAAFEVLSALPDVPTKRGHHV